MSLWKSIMPLPPDYCFSMVFMVNGSSLLSIVVLMFSEFQRGLWESIHSWRVLPQHMANVVGEGVV